MVNIKIKEKNGQQLVSARDLYEYLGYDKTQYSRWSKSKIEKNEFAIENVDWQGFDINVKGNKVKDYAITIDFAKRISMMAKTAKGEEARNYFIEVEKKAKELYNATKSISDYSNDPFIALRMRQIDQEKEIKALNEKVEEINIRTQTRPDFFTIVGYATLNGLTVNLSLASQIGRKASKRCKELGIETDTIPDARFGIVKMYPKKVLAEVFSNPLSSING